MLENDGSLKSWVLIASSLRESQRRCMEKKKCVWWEILTCPAVMYPGNWTWSVLKWLENSVSCGLADDNVKTKLLTASRFCPDSEASPVLSGVLRCAPLFQFLACKLVCPSDTCGLIVTTCIPHWLHWWQCSTFVHFCVSVSQDFTFYSKLSSHRRY